jgi:hypothetical protein
MKIAVYGDSYGCTPPLNRKLNDQPGWFEMLKNHVNGNSTNYSIGGSSFYYAYKNFLEYNSKYDKNIVLGSLTGRCYTPHLVWPHVNIDIVNHPDIWKDHGLTQEQINAFTLYYKYVYNNKEEEDMRLLMSKEIMNVPNTLYISLPETLVQVTFREREFFNYKVTEKENMSAHISNESNKTFFNSILNWITTGNFTFNLDDYKLPNIQDRYKYYI